MPFRTRYDRAKSKDYLRTTVINLGDFVVKSLINIKEIILFVSYLIPYLYVSVETINVNP
jgi:hypothetical protein